MSAGTSSENYNSRILRNRKQAPHQRTSRVQISRNRKRDPTGRCLWRRARIPSPAVRVHLLFGVLHCRFLLFERLRNFIPSYWRPIVQSGPSSHRAAVLWLATALPLTAERAVSGIGLRRGNEPFKTRGKDLSEPPGQALLRNAGESDALGWCCIWRRWQAQTHGWSGLQRV